MKSLTLKSPAKINLYLKVTGRRPNGYHELVTLFRRLSLADSLTLKKQKSGIRLSCVVKSGLKQKLSNGEDNLIVKTYRLLQKEFPGLGGVSVKLVKRIPMGAGLGGGSSNAAAFLLGMKKIYNLPLSRGKMMKIGARLGADVPFFLMETSQALGRGIGDELKAMPSRSKYGLTLVVSDEGLSTPQVYRNLPKKLPAVSLTKVNSAVKLVFNLLEKKQVAKAAPLLENDLENPAFRLRPSLGKQLKKLHQKGVRASRMTGSGPTLFSVLPDLRAARQFAEKLRKDFPRNKILVCSSF